MTHLILASASPRRREILRGLGLAFTVCPAQGEEKSDKTDPCELVEDLARHKGREVYDRLKAEGKLTESDLILSCDTVVSLDGEILGKPKDLADAKRMLTELSGRTHTVASGVALTLPDGRQFSSRDTTLVSFFAVSDGEIDAYLASEKVLDKAGAYAIQGGASRFVRHIEGDYLNVVGLPLFELLSLYRKKFGKNFLSSMEKAPIL